MILDKGKARRIAIFFFYDSDGVVDDYIPYMLRDLQNSIQDFCIVVNGKLNEEGEHRFREFTDQIILRKNKGLDVSAYKEAIRTIGYDKLSEYDELVLMNYTIMGPVYPFSEMFDSMAERDLDFWGITKFHGEKDDPWGLTREGRIREHIQSHFICVRKSLLSSEEFKSYWKDMPKIRTYQESVSYHEAYFTHHFASEGYKWQVYADSDDLKYYTNHPVLYAPLQMIREKRCPIFKRRSFMNNYADMLNRGVGETSRELLEYLRFETDYDTNMIWDNILRCNDMSSIKDNLHLEYVLPSKFSDDVQPVIDKNRIALICHIYFEDQIEYCYRHISNMPPEADIYITTDTREKVEKIKECFVSLNCHHLDVRLVPNHGRDVSAFLVGVQDVIMNYDIICHIHDKKVVQSGQGSIGYGFSYHCFENLLRSKDYVKNLLQTFDENPRLGILMPSPPNHQDYYITFGLEWGSNYKKTKKLADKMGLCAPMHKHAEPIAPLGGMKWFRTDALKAMFEYGWQYEDFPDEPLPVDGTISHVIERIYPFVAQDAGYYSAWCFADDVAALEMNNLSYMLRGMNTAVQAGQIAGKYIDVITQLTVKSKALSQLEAAYDQLDALYHNNHRVPDMDMKLYIDKGNGFCEEDMFICSVMYQSGRFDVEFDISKKGKVIKMLRFDPGEASGIILEDVRFIITFADGEDTVMDLSACTTNGYFYRRKVIFFAADPQLLVTIRDKRKICRVRVIGRVDTDFSQKKINGALNQRIPGMTPKMYYNIGNGITEENTIVAPNLGDVRELKVDFDFRGITNDIQELRFDPCETSLFILSGAVAEMQFSNGSRQTINMAECRHNATNAGEDLVFLTNDPQITWKTPAGLKLDRVIITAKVTDHLDNEWQKASLTRNNVAKYIANKIIK